MTDLVSTPGRVVVVSCSWNLEYQEGKQQTTSSYLSVEKTRQFVFQYPNLGLQALIRIQALRGEAISTITRASGERVPCADHSLSIPILVRGGIGSA